MASLREGFGHFYSPEDDAVALALRTGLVSADTNVLLSMYRLQPSAREDLLGALDIIGERLWIPHQVAYEFHRNRLNVIAGQETYFSKTGEELDSAIKEYLSRFRAFTNRIALPAARAHELKEMIEQTHRAVKDQVISAGEANEIHLDNRDSDEVLRRLESLFNNRVGDPMTSDELDAARKEAKRRVDAKIPPGYMDKDKSDPTGDYLLWKQLKKEAATRKLPVVFITDDRKEDWFWREHGQTIGARYEMREEMAAEAGVPFLIMTTETFLVQAERYLKVSVSPETVNQAKELPDSLDDHAITQLEAAYQERLQNSERNRRRVERRLMSVRAELAVLEEELSARQRRGELTESNEQHIGKIDRQRYNLFAAQGDMAELLQDRQEIVSAIAALRMGPTDTQKLRASTYAASNAP